MQRHISKPHTNGSLLRSACLCDERKGRLICHAILAEMPDVRQNVALFLNIKLILVCQNDGDSEQKMEFFVQARGHL